MRPDRRGIADGSRGNDRRHPFNQPFGGAATVKHPTQLGVAESNHHQVFTDGNFVFDPMYSINPTPRAEYKVLLRQLNGQSIDLSFFSAQQ
jgi:hypothetical protein